MNDSWKDRLSDYVDDELTPEERSEIEAKLAEDPGAAALVEDLRSIQSEAADLQDREPENDLWSGIEAAIGADKSPGHAPRLAAVAPMRSRYSFSTQQLAIAAAVLIMLTAGITALTTRSLLNGSADDATNLAERAPGDSSPETLPTSGGNGELANTDPASNPGRSLRGPALDDAIEMAGFDSRQRYDASVARLESIFTRGKAGLDSTTVATLERNLAIADRVIFQARGALEDNPGDSYLSAHLAKAMRHKVKLLKRMARISQDAL